MFEIVPRLLGFKETAAVLDGTPEVFKKTYRHWMFSERMRYHKVFSRQIMRARYNEGAPSMFRRHGAWEPRVAAPFKGMSIREQPNGITMEVGLGTENRKAKNASFIKRLMLMERSFPGSEMTSSGKLMPIPLIRNLDRLNVMRPRRGSNSYLKNAETALSGGMGQKGLIPIKRGGTIYWFNTMDRMKNGRLRKSALLFIGKRMVRLRKRLDFVKPWEGRKDQMVDNFVVKMNRTLRNISRGYLSDA